MLMTRDGTLDTAALLDRLDAAMPVIRANIDVADTTRDTPASSIDALRDAGLFRLFQPRRWGGIEADPRALPLLQQKMAEACPSTAWVYGVLTVQAFVLALFGDQAQTDVWGEDGDALVSSSFAPVGVAEAVEGGWRVSGRWSFSSGSSHAGWALLGARMPGVAPAPGPPPLNLFLVPRADFVIDDVWHTFGLRGTGSNDIVGTDMFVPAHRHLRLDPGIQNMLEAARPGSALYRLPWLYLFTASISSFAVGAARGALEGFLAVTRERTSPLSGKVAKEDPAAQQAAARLAAEIDMIGAIYDRHLSRLEAHVAADTLIPMADAMLIRSQLSGALRRLAALVDDLMMLQGARAIELSSPVARAWLDLSAARAHIGNDPTGATTMLGAALLAG